LSIEDPEARISADHRPSRYGWTVDHPPIDPLSTHSEKEARDATAHVFAASSRSLTEFLPPLRR
jgi:hypothetical protein